MQVICFLWMSGILINTQDHTHWANQPVAPVTGTLETEKRLQMISVKHDTFIWQETVFEPSRSQPSYVIVADTFAMHPPSRHPTASFIWMRGLWNNIFVREKKTCNKRRQFYLCSRPCPTQTIYFCGNNDWAYWSIMPLHSQRYKHVSMLKWLARHEWLS